MGDVQTSMKKVRIVVAEDSPTQAVRIKHALDSRKYEIHLAGDGASALELVKKHRPDLIISDVNMPVMDGYELCKAIHEVEDFKAVPFMLLTSLDDPVSIFKGLAVGANHYVTKPFADRELKKRVEQILAKGDVPDQVVVSDDGKTTEMRVDITGEIFNIKAETTEILRFLLSTYEDALQQKKLLLEAQDELRSLNVNLEKEVERRTGLLMDSEQSYAAMMEQNPDAMIIVNQQGQVAYSNTAAQALLCDGQDLAGTDWDFPLNEIRPIEHTIRHPGKSAITVEIRTTEGSWQGESAHLVILRDISAEKKHEQDLLKAATEWRNCFDSLDHMMLITDRDFKIERVNRAVADTLGLTFKQILGQPYHRMLFGREHPLKDCPVEKSFQTGKAQTRESYEPHLDRTVVTTVSPVKDLEGRVTHCVLVLKDVSHERRQEAETERLNRTLAESFTGITEALSDLAESQDPYTAGHSRQVCDIALKIGRKLKLPEQDLQGLRVCALLHDIGKVVVPLGILNKPGKLSGNEWGIIQSHSNNAYEYLKHIPFPWPVAEVVRQHHERLNGNGYPQKLKGAEIHIWARILAVADVVDAMISHRPYRPGLPWKTVAAELKKGSGETYDPEVIDACADLMSVPDKRIMVIDDEPVILDSLVGIIGKMGLEVETYSDPIKAVKSFADNPFPVVLTDMNMPGMNGLELLQKVQEHKRDTKVIIITGYGGKEHVLKALRLGAYNFLEKPISAKEIREIVSSAFEADGLLPYGH